MKRIVCIMLLLTLALSIVSCGEYRDGFKGDDKNNNIYQDGYPDGSMLQPELDDDPTNDFTVQLYVGDLPFQPTTALNVYWNDGYNVHVAPVDQNGYAVIDGLDGDYRVTLSTTPSGYAYDPNDNIATNDKRNIEIELLPLNILRGSGTNKYDRYQIDTTGVYTVTINSADEECFISFAPKNNGTYTVESWVNVVDDDVNPYCTAYQGSSQFVGEGYRVTATGVCGNYTRNFIHTVTIADSNISSGGGGSQTFTFSIGAKTKSNVYPVNITFAVKRNGDFDLPEGVKTVVLPKQDWTGFDFDAFNKLAGGTIVTAGNIYPGTTNCYLFDQDNYRVGPDGVYHLYDMEKYESTNGFGPILVAYISVPTPFIEKPFTLIDYEGYGALTKVQSQYNYKLFIEGFDGAVNGGYYCATDCPCHLDGSPRACPEGCMDCTSECRNYPPEQEGVRGYADFCNSDGVAPVTPELALFLQRYSEGMRLYADGGGWVDSAQIPDPNDPSVIYVYDAYEDSQWLFACGYYK